MLESPENRSVREDALRLRWIRQTWRHAALIHGFDEVDALSRADDPPISGHEVDLSALASRRLAATGVPRSFAIRHWPDPDKPQKGRTSEYWAASCRIFSDPSVRADAEVIACAVESLRLLGLSPQRVKVRISHRDAVRSLLARRGVELEQLAAWFPLLHQAGKMSNDDFISGALELGMEAKVALDVLRVLAMSTPYENPTTQLFLSEQAGGRGPEYFKGLFAELRAMGVAEWCVLNLGIVRAGAHHTGMVFEVHDAAGRGRSIGGGGRSGFDDAIDAVGFDMGDAALLELLRDSSLYPASRSLAERLGARADVVVASVDDDETSAAVLPAVASLRQAGFLTHRIDAPVSDAAELLMRARSTPGGGCRYAVLIESATGPGAARVINVDAGVASAQSMPLDLVTDFVRRSTRQ